MDNDNPSDKAEAAEPEPERQSEAAPPPETAPLPDYLTNPDAVSADEGVQWRFGRAPNYSNTRRVWREEKTANHAAGSLPELVENLVKNWEVEASFKTRLSDWRTIDHEKYTFAMNGEAPQTAEHMLKCGTYNAIITPNEYYCPLHSDFASSHKTFKRMMPTFAWEVLEVYSGPPKVAFKWRHWGVMKNDYVGFNDKGEKVTAKAHGGPIEIFGVTVASVDAKVRLQNVDTYMDPLQMFRRIAPNGVVNKQPMNRKVELADALEPESETARAATVPDVQQPASETTIEPMSSLNACPFAPSQQIDTESSRQQLDDPLVGTAANHNDPPVAMEHEESQQTLDGTGVTLSNRNQTKQSISDLQVHEDRGHENEKDLALQTSKIVEESSIVSAQDSQPVLNGHEVASEHSMPNAEPADYKSIDPETQVPKVVEGQTLSSAGEAQPLLNGHKATAEDSMTMPEPGDHKGTELDTQASNIIEKHTVASAQDTPLALNGSELANEESKTKLQLNDPPLAASNAQDVANLTDIAEHSEQQTLGDTQTAANLKETSESLKKHPNARSQPLPMSETHLAQDIYPHPKTVEALVLPEPGEAVAASSGTEEAQKTHEEMSKITPQELEQMNIE